MSKTIKRNCILSARSRRLIEHIIKQKSNKAEKRSVVLYAHGALFFLPISVAKVRQPSHRPRSLTGV